MMRKIKNKYCLSYKEIIYQNDKSLINLTPVSAGEFRVGDPTSGIDKGWEKKLAGWILSF